MPETIEERLRRLEAEADGGQADPVEARLKQLEAEAAPKPAEAMRFKLAGAPRDEWTQMRATNMREYARRLNALMRSPNADDQEWARSIVADLGPVEAAPVTTEGLNVLAKTLEAAREAKLARFRELEAGTGGPRHPVHRSL